VLARVKCGFSGLVSKCLDLIFLVRAKPWQFSEMQSSVYETSCC